MSTTDQSAHRDRNRRSRELWDRAAEVIVGGGQAHKRPLNYLARGGPAFIARAEGARFWDADGNEYIDYLMGYGPIVLGHSDPVFNAAIVDQLARGAVFSLEHEAEIVLAEELCRLIPCAEMVLYFIGGSSATLGALRCARAHTGRSRVIRCGYHGWFDWCWPGKPGVPAAESDLVRSVPYGDLAGLGAALERERGTFAAVIVEAEQENGPPPGYFAGVRRLCDEHGAVFVLDEVKTGFRLGLGGAQQVYRIDCDLATFGKAMGNGFPGAALVGKRAILAARTDAYCSATFHGDPLSTVAALTTIAELRRRDGIAHFQRLGSRLVEGLNRVFAESGFPCRMVGHVAMPTPVECAETDACTPLPPEWKGKARTEWCAAMQRRGVFVNGHCWFLSCAHTTADIDQTIATGAAAIGDALAVLRAEAPVARSAAG